jgi:hypothetical protein
MRVACLIRLKERVQSVSMLVPWMRSGLLTLVVAVLLAGCGGGTRGSGGQFYEGFVGDSGGKALSNVMVTLLASGDSATSDAQGRFVIETEGLAGALDVMLEGDGFQATTTTAPVPADAKRVRLTLTVVSVGQRPQVTSTVEVVERTEAEGDSGRGDDGDDDSRDDDDGGSDDDDDQDDSNGDDGDDVGDDDGRDDSNDDDGSSGGDDDQDDSSDDSSGGSSGSGGGSDGSDDDGAPRDGDSKRAEGTISRLSSTSVTVSGVDFLLSSSSDLRDADGNPTSLSSFAVGQKVKARGRYQGGVLVLERLELDD